jgi:enamine deaminase RidA (YjgF/YER057c/UK114 family)
MYAHHPERRVRARSSVTSVRRFSGPVADQLFVLIRPEDGGSDPARQAEATYDALREALASEGADPGAVVSETVFLRHVGGADVVRSARSHVFGDAIVRPATTVIGQAPLDAPVDLSVAAMAMLPRAPGSSAHDIRRNAAGTCGAPGAHARVVRVGGQTSLWTGNVYGSGTTAVDEASEMFRAADALLADAGMRFTDVLRTWIHVRDIDRDYGALNEARRAFFRDRGISRRPASTGVQGIPAPAAHAFSMSLFAIRSDRPLGVEPMSTPSLNEAWSYGADFSRGLRVADANQVTLHVSGTASVDEVGRTAHVDDFAPQAERMLHNVATLLERQGAGFGDLVSGVAYLKHARDAAALGEIRRAHGFDGFPCAVVEAPLCRPDLLCEVEAVAVLPLATAGA